MITLFNWILSLEKKKGNANKKQQTEEYNKLEQTKDPLADVAKYVASVNQHFPQRLDTHLLSFEYYSLESRKKI